MIFNEGDIILGSRESVRQVHRFLYPSAGGAGGLQEGDARWGSSVDQEAGQRRDTLASEPELNGCKHLLKA